MGFRTHFGAMDGITRNLIIHNPIAFYGNLSGMLWLVIHYCFYFVGGEAFVFWLVLLYFSPSLFFGLFVGYAMKKYPKYVALSEWPFLLAVFGSFIYLGVLYFFFGKNFRMLEEVRQIIGGGIGAFFFVMLWLEMYRIKSRVYILMIAFLIGTMASTGYYFLNVLSPQNFFFGLPVMIFAWQSGISILMNFSFKKFGDVL